MNPKCTCAEKSTTSHNCTKNIVCESDKSIVLVDFGKIPFFHEVSKEIDIDLKICEDEVTLFKIKRAVKLYYDCDFTILPNEGEIEKGARKLKLKCFYRPKIPFLRNVQLFECDIGELKLTITARGESTGPVVTVSERHIYFYQTPENIKGKQIFILKNSSKIPAEFMFDIDTKQKLFTLTPLKGIITKELYIKVFFNPKEFGIYSQKLYCLIFGNEPAVVNLIGIYSKEKVDPNNLSYIHYPFLLEETILYDGYFRNFLEGSIDRKHSPVYLTPRYIDMGKIVQTEDKILEPDYDIQQKTLDNGEQKLLYSSKNFNITNELKHNITVNWIEDDPIFKIFPKVTTIPGQQSKFFKCIFTPPSNESVYFRKLTAQIYWTCDIVENNNPNQTFIVPLTLTINLQGNTFPKGQHSLINIEIKPATIVFPPSLVNTVVYENFTIINSLNRPVIFKLVAPSNRAKIEDVKRITAHTINDIKRAREKELDDETKDFCELFDIDFNKVRQQNKKKIREKIASHSRMLRIKYITRKENIANIARTILEEMRRNKKILEKLNKTYDYKVTRNEWTIEDMVVVGTAMSLHKRESEIDVVEESNPVEPEVIEDDKTTFPKKGKREKNKKSTEKEAKKDKAEKKDKKDKVEKKEKKDKAEKIEKKDKAEKKEKKGKKDEKKKDKKSKKGKKRESDAAIPIEITLSQSQYMSELVEEFEHFDEMMEDQHMAKQSPEESYPIDPHFSCHPQTLLYDNYDNGKVYRKTFKVRNNSFMPRKFRFLHLTTANEYETLLFKLKPLIGIQKLVGGASISMLLLFSPTPECNEIEAKLIFLSFDDKTQSYQKFCVYVQCTLKRPNLQISSNHIYFGKIPIWQTSRCIKRLTLSNDGLEPCDIYIKRIKDPFDGEDEAITNMSNNDSVVEFNNELENENVIRNVTSEIIENVFANFHFTHTYVKLESLETKAINIFLKNIDYYGSYIEKHLVEAYDERQINFANYEVVTEAYITGPFISVFPETLDYEICSINSVYQLPMDIKNSSLTTQAVAIKVPLSMRDYVKPDVVNIYLPPKGARTVTIRLLLGKSIMNTVYFNQELFLLELTLQICILTKNYNEVPPVTATLFAIITLPNSLNITPVDNTFASYMSNCLVLDVGKCTIFETVYTDIEVKNNSLIPQIYGFMDLPHWITIEPNYGFTEIIPGCKQSFRLFIHPEYQDLLKTFDKKKVKDYSLLSVLRIETINNNRTPNTFFDSKKLRKSIQVVLKEMTNPINSELIDDISDCMRSIKKTYFNNDDNENIYTEEELTIISEWPTRMSIFANEDVEEENYSDEEDEMLNITQVMVKVNVIKPLVEVSFQHIELPDTPCSSYSVISVDIRALRFEFSQECEFLRKKDMKLQKYEAWFKITGNNKEIRVEPSCGILKNGETRKIFLIATPTTPEYIIQKTARSIKYSEIYELKRREFELGKNKKVRKKDAKKTKKLKIEKPNKRSKDKKDKKVKNKKGKSTTSVTAKETKEENVEPEITVSDSEINVSYEDYFPSEMCYWRTMKPYTISSKLTCIVTYSSDFFIRPKEVINMDVYCRVIRPDFISNLKLQRIDFGNVAVGMSGIKNVIIQNIKYDTIKAKINLLNPVGPFSVSYVKNPKIPAEGYLNVPFKFSPKSDEFFEEYIEITSGATVLPLILQGDGVETKVTFSPVFLVCRLNKATTKTIEEYLLKIQNLSEAPVTVVFEKVMEIEGALKPIPIVKKEQDKKKPDVKGGGDKASKKSKDSKKSKGSTGSKVKSAKKFSDDLSPSEIYSIPMFVPTKNTIHFDILNVENNALTLQANTTGTVKIGFGMKDMLDKTKIQLKEKKKKEKTSKDKSLKQNKSSVKSLALTEEKLTYITKYNIAVGANILKEIILVGNFK